MKDINFSKFTEYHARLRAFMNFVIEKYPKIYKEFCEIEKRQEKDFKVLKKVLKKQK